MNRRRGMLGPVLLALGFLLPSCGGGDSGPTAASTPTPLTARGTIVPSGTGIAGLTAFRFDGSATSGADGYAWDFGDGQQGSGSTCEHTYAKAGTFSVTLTATGGGKTAVASLGSVTVAPTVTGVWDVTRFSILGNPFVYRLEQNGPSITGLVQMMGGFAEDAGEVVADGPITAGSLPDAGRSALPCPISITARYDNGFTFTLVGTYTDANTIVGTCHYGSGTLRRRTSS